MIQSKTIIYFFCREFFYFISLLSLCFAMPLFGAGIALMEQSVKEMGLAFSGAPTNFDDASMVFFNPAAMSQSKTRLVSIAGYIVAPSVNFHNESSHFGPASRGIPLLGNNGGNSGNLAFIPNIYYVHPLTTRITLGFGFNTLFGMKNSYDSGWKGRYQALDSEIRNANFNPSLAFKVTENFSLGVGFNVQYMQAILTNAIDFGAICVRFRNPSECLSEGSLPQLNDGHVSLKGDSVGFGYNFGAFYTINPNTRVGVSYRSRIFHDIHSKANFSVPDNASVFTRGGQFVDTHAQSSVTLPDNVLFGFSHRITPQWTLSADAMWTNWSLIRELKTDFASAQRDDALTLNWHNTWRLAVGVNYQPESNKWALRSGFAYDQSPVSGAHLRSPRIPDGDRYWFTLGLSYALFQNINIHAAYAHLFVNDLAINRQGTSGDFLNGQYSEQFNIGGLQLDWRF